MSPNARTPDAPIPHPAPTAALADKSPPPRHADLSLPFLLRQAPDFWHDPLACLLDWQCEHGDLLRIQAPGLPPLFLVGHPALAHQVLQVRAGRYRKNPYFRLLRLGFADGLLESEGGLWQRQRRTLQPLFHGGHLEEKIAPRLQQGLALWLDRWRQADTVVDIEQEMVHLTHHLLHHLLFGTSLWEMVRPLREDFLRLARPSFVRLVTLTPTGRRLRRTYRELEAHLTALIRRQRQGKGDPDCLLQDLLEARDPRTGRRMSDTQLLHELVTLLFAGTETTAQALTWTWYLLATHPEAERRLHREFEGLPIDGFPSPQGLQRLRYLTLVIHESLRLYPPSWANGRRAIRQDSLAGLPVPPGSRLLVSQYLVHRHPGFWEAPDAFRPERFSDAARPGLPHLAYFPFGVGPRRCLGDDLAMLELRMVLATLGSRFRVRLLPGQDIRPEASVTLRPRGGIKVWVEQRQPSGRPFSRAPADSGSGGPPRPRPPA